MPSFEEQKIVQLTDEQKKAVRKWVEDGLSLSEIQKQLSSELGLSMTFMEARLLVLDLGLSVKERPSAKTGKKEADLKAIKEEGAEEEDLDGAGELAGGGNVTVQADRIVKPGTVISGTVKFSDGVTATWGLDSMGRLMLGGARPGYQPNEQDLRQFQVELRKILAQKGY